MKLQREEFTKYELQITNYKSQIINDKSHITNHKSQITYYKLQITNWKLQITKYKMCKNDCNKEGHWGCSPAWDASHLLYWYSKTINLKIKSLIFNFSFWFLIHNLQFAPLILLLQDNQHQDEKSNFQFLFLVFNSQFGICSIDTMTINLKIKSLIFNFCFCFFICILLQWYYKTINSRIKSLIFNFSFWFLICNLLQWYSKTINSRIKSGPCNLSSCFSRIGSLLSERGWELKIVAGWSIGLVPF